MARTANEKHRKNKEIKILDGARAVFCRKGYLNVTMQDIINECGISRGGIYLYFSSVDEIFQEVAARRNKAKFAAVRKSVNDNEPFASVLSDYMNLQKERLLNMEGSLLRAMYEYIFSKVEGSSEVFRNVQSESIRKSVLSVLMLGVKQKVIRDEGIPALADHFVVVIEGLSVFALTEALTEKIARDQFAILEKMVEQLKIEPI